MSRVQVVVAVLMVGLTVPVSAQRSAVNDAAEIERLRDTAYLVERDLASLNQRDTPRAAQLQLRFEELQEEIVYLKVKQRKDGSVQRREYADLRDRLEDLRAEARTVSTPTSPVTPRSTASAAPVQSVLEIPVGTEIDVRMTDSLDSGTAMIEDRFEATRRCDRSQPGDAYQSHGASDGELRPGHRERAGASDSRHGNRGDSGQRHERRDRARWRRCRRRRFDWRSAGWHEGCADRRRDRRYRNASGN
jgi:hypothetical protein